MSNASGPSSRCRRTAAPTGHQRPRRLPRPRLATRPASTSDAAASRHSASCSGCSRPTGRRRPPRTPGRRGPAQQQCRRLAAARRIRRAARRSASTGRGQCRCVVRRPAPRPGRRPAGPPGRTATGRTVSPLRSDDDQVTSSGRAASGGRAASCRRPTAASLSAPNRRDSPPARTIAATRSERRHRADGPSASRIGTSLATDSASSASGSDPATMPQPANSRICRGSVSLISPQRRAMAHSPSPAGVDPADRSGVALPVQVLQLGDQLPGRVGRRAADRRRRVQGRGQGQRADAGLGDRRSRRWPGAARWAAPARTAPRARSCRSRTATAPGRPRRTAYSCSSRSLLDWASAAARFRS